MIEQGIFDYLSTYADLALLVGQRIYPLVIPQGVTMPAISYHKVSEYKPFPGLGFVEVRIQFSCHGETYEQAKRVAEKVKAAFNGRVQFTTGTVYAEPENEVDVFDFETGNFLIPVDITFKF